MLTTQGFNTGTGSGVTLIGYPGPLFSVIHVSGMCCALVSFVTTTSLLFYLCIFRSSVKTSGLKIRKGQNESCKTETDSMNVVGKIARRMNDHTRPLFTFWKWNIGERFVVYLAVCDLCLSIAPFIEHCYMYVMEDHPPFRICAGIGFFVVTFGFMQCLIIMASAVSACSVVVFGKKLSFGRRDWRLLSTVLGVPTVNGIICLSLDLLGPSGAWCAANLGTNSGRVCSAMVGTCQIVFFIVIAIAYGVIWIKIRRTAKCIAGSTTERYQNSAKVMMIFVLAFAVQYWSVSLYSFYSFFANPPTEYLVIVVYFIDLGGVFNTIAYTVIRRRLLKEQESNNPKVVNDNHSEITIPNSSSVSMIAVSDVRENP